jgi:hypothetical protein
VNLHDVAKKHGTDKAEHGYCGLYERLLVPHVGTPCRLLEIGIWHGASLRMWREWLGPLALIVGLDDDPALREEHEALQAQGFQIFHGHQEDVRTLGAITTAFGPFDIIIDDGGHYAPSQFSSFNFLWPHVRPEGWYVVEDLLTADNPRLTPKHDESMAARMSFLLEGIAVGTRAEFEEAVVRREVVALKKARA